MRRAPAICLAGLGAMILSVFLHVTSGWVGTLLLTMPGFAFASMVRGHEMSLFAPWMFAGNLAFYTLIFWPVVWWFRRSHGR